MDKAALAFIEILNDPKDDDQKSRYPLDERMKVFNLGRDWLIRRTKLRPKTEDESPGIDEIRKLIAEQAEQGGYVRKAARGRPTKAEAERRKAERTPGQRRDDSRDDSGLRKLLGGAAPDDEEDDEQ